MSQSLKLQVFEVTLKNQPIRIKEMSAIRLRPLILITLSLLAIPFIAMQFTSEVNWSASDFLVMAVLLMGCGLAVELIRIKASAKPVRIALTVIAILAFLLLWAELAVGIFGSPLAGS